MNRFAGFVQNAGEGVYRTGEKAEECAGINLSAVDWKRGDGVLDLEAGVGSGKLVGELNFVGGFGVGGGLSQRAEWKQ
jgi:hypothetical protein